MDESSMVLLSCVESLSTSSKEMSATKPRWSDSSATSETGERMSFYRTDKARNTSSGGSVASVTHGSGSYEEDTGAMEEDEATV